jgi:hypothetical protein
MDPVRPGLRPGAEVLHRESWSPIGRSPALGRGTSSPGVLVLDVIYLAATLALFALVGVIAKAVEKL